MIKSAVKNDAGILAELAIQMWHDSTVLDLEKEFTMKNVTCHVTIFTKECVVIGFNISSHST